MGPVSKSRLVIAFCSYCSMRYSGVRVSEMALAWFALNSLAGRAREGVHAPSSFRASSEPAYWRSQPVRSAKSQCRSLRCHGGVSWPWPYLLRCSWVAPWAWRREAGGVARAYALRIGFGQTSLC